MELIKAECSILNMSEKEYEGKKRRLLAVYDVKTEFVKNGMIYCKKCKDPKLCDIPERNFVVRCACDCEIKAWEQERAKKEREESYLRFLEKRRSINAIGKIFHNASFYRMDVPQDNESLETITRCEKFCNEFEKRFLDGKGIWLYGGVGTGKTYLAACMFNRLDSQHYRCIFTNSTTVFSSLKGSYGRYNDETMEALKWADIVIIDKIDEAFITPSESVYAAKMLGEIIRVRFEDRRPTVIIGERSILDFSAQKNISDLNVDVMISSMVQMRLSGKNRRLNRK